MICPWEIVFSRHAVKDAKKLTAAGLKIKAHEPLADPPKIHSRTLRPTRSRMGWGLTGRRQG